jgi:hypothetical protein
MIRYKWPVATAIPQNPAVRLEIAKALHTLLEEDDERLRQRRAEIASIRQGLAEIAHDIAEFRRAAPALILSELRKYGYNPDEPRVPKGDPGPGQWTGEAPAPRHASTLVIKHPGAWTGNSRIDETTDKLVTLLAGVTETIKKTPDMSPQRYGQLVHQSFAKAVVAAGLQGIGPNDVETTFPNGPYGSPGSIRTDVVLRGDDGNIIAIYDVKTGEADLTPARAQQLRIKTGAPSGTKVIQLRFNEALSKRQSLGIVVH